MQSLNMAHGDLDVSNEMIGFAAEPTHLSLLTALTISQVFGKCQRKEVHLYQIEKKLLYFEELCLL